MSDNDRIASAKLASSSRRAGDPVVGPADPKTVHEHIQRSYEEEKNYRNAHPILPNVPLTGAHPDSTPVGTLKNRGSIMKTVDSAVTGK